MASRENQTRALVEKIDDAIEQAEDLGLTFVAGILMIARLEAVQPDTATLGGRGTQEGS
jgi:zinc transporter ZupT